MVWADGGSLAPGTVFGQDPFGGYAAKEGSVVRVTVAGPEPGSVVPLVLGDPAAAAQADLEALGLVVEVIVEPESNPEDAERRSGLTWKQTPAAGTELSRTATIWINP